MSLAMNTLRERVAGRQAELVKELELRRNYAGDPNPSQTQYLFGKAEVLGQVLAWIDEMNPKPRERTKP